VTPGIIVESVSVEMPLGKYIGLGASNQGFYLAVVFDISNLVKPKFGIRFVGVNSHSS
jgi:hypothetical protein